MALSTWAIFALAVLVASISPGPNVLIVMVHSLKYGWKSTVFTMIGNVFCLFLFGLLAAIGVGALIKTAPIAFTTMKIIGGLYLGYTGLKMILSSFGKNDAMALDMGDTGPAKPKPFALVSQAFFVAASNPKAILFMSAIFPQFIDPVAPVVPQFSILFLTTAVAVVMVHAFYGWVADRFRVRLVSEKVRKIVARISGTAFIGLGAGVAFSR